MERFQLPNWKKFEVIVFALEGIAVSVFAGAIALDAVARSPFQAPATAAHILLAAGFWAAWVAHNLLGRRPLYWGHFDFLVAVFFLYLLSHLYYSQAPSVSCRTLAWTLDGLWAYGMGRYLFFRRLRWFNVVLLLVLFAVWGYAEIVQTRSPGQVPVGLESAQRFAFVLGLLLLMAQPFLLLRKPANFVFGLWAAAILLGVSVWGVQSLLDVLEMLRRGTLPAWMAPQSQTLVTFWRLIGAFPLVGGGIGTWPWVAAAFRPVGFVELVPNVPGALRMPAELGVVGTALFAIAWLRIPWFVARRWELFPNRRLRMSVLILLTIILVATARLLVADDFGQPWSWTVLWGIFGTFASLVAVRDPIRIFYGSSAGPGVLPRATQRLAGSSPEAASNPRRPAPIDPSRGVRLSPAFVLRLVTVSLVIVVSAIVQLIPYRAGALAERAAGETLADASYGARLERAIRLCPVFAEGWVRLARHYQERAAGDALALAALGPRIEAAYRRAIRFNPYEPNYYEQLAFYYVDSNAAPRALEVLRQGVANNPNHLVLRLLLVRELERAQSYALATWHLRQAILRIAPQQAELFIRLAELYELRGMRMDAVRSCQYARQGLPDSSSALLRLRRVAERLRIAQALP